MQIGVHLPHIGRKATPEAVTRAAVQAEELGLADVWVSEHVILPKDAPYPPSPAFLEPILTLAWAAAATKRVRLGTSVIVLPMHHPVPIAKQLATLQTLSNGRVIFGIGVGWLEAEFSALGVPFRERGRRTDESIALLRALWSQDPVTFKPRYWATQIEEMRMQPPPSAPIPLWVGGSSDKALERAVNLCDGWHGSRLTAEAAAPVIKVATRSELARRWKDLIDFDAGRIATGEMTIEETGWELFRLILDVASGRTKVWSERWGIHNDLTLFNPAPVT